MAKQANTNGDFLSAVKAAWRYFSPVAPVAIDKIKKSRVLTNAELEAIARQAAEATQRMLERWRGTM